jgi:predicted HicB family RNase H-like nuclease
MSSRCYLYEMAEKQYPSDKQDKFMLRFPEGMRERIRIAAEKNGRSMNAEIVSRLEESFQSEQTLQRYNMMSVTLDEKLEKVREEIDQMERSKSEASELIEQLQAMTTRKESQEQS